jgi:hypothetical protein
MNDRYIIDHLQSRLREAERLLARRDAQLAAARGENVGLLTALEREIGASREWQEVAVDLGAFAQVEKRANRTILYGSIEIAADLIAAAGTHRATMITAIVKDKMLRPMIMKAEGGYPNTVPETSLQTTKAPQGASKPT